MNNGKPIPSAAFVSNRLEYLKQSVSNFIQNSKLYALCNKVLDDKRFQDAPAARMMHQAYHGGLVVHTAEVMDCALRMAHCHHLKVDLDVLITSCIFHDYGKIWDYKPKMISIGTDVKTGAVEFSECSNEYDYTQHQQLIRHLPRSYAEFLNMAGDVPDDIKEQVCHCILAHHGRQEWGSPTEPKTVEAYILHAADNISAKCALDEYNL
jgi:3'-5' exoribonuclease